MTGAPSAICDNCGSSLHDGLPRRISHRCDQHVARSEVSKAIGIGEQMHPTMSDLLSNCLAGHESPARALIHQPVRFDVVVTTCRMDRLRAGLQYVELSGPS